MSCLKSKNNNKKKREPMVMVDPLDLGHGKKGREEGMICKCISPKFVLSMII